MEETISLRELVDILLKGKWVIAAVTVMAVAAAAIASFWLIDPVYSVKATVSVNNGLIPGKEVSETDSYNQIITPADYTERVKSPGVIEKAIQKSRLTNYSVSEVQSNLTVENPQNTNIVNLSLKGKKPVDAKRLLDAILLSVKESLLKEIRGRIKADSQHYASQAKAERKHLEQLLKEYSEKAQMLKLPPSILLDAAISYNNQYMMNIDQEHLSGITSMSGKDLIELNNLSNDIKSSSQVYQDNLSKERELEEYSKTFTVDNKVLTLSAPIVPAAPDSPKPLLNIAIAFVVGLMTGAGIVFFRHYWQESKQEESLNF